MTKMTIAEEYAQSLSDRYNTASDSGTPFGVVYVDNGEFFDTYEEARESYPEAEEGAFEELVAMDLLSDALDIDYVLNYDLKYKGAIILITYGGPTTFIDTVNRKLEVHWGFGIAYKSLPQDFIDGLDEALEELYEMKK